MQIRINGQDREMDRPVAMSGLAKIELFLVKFLSLLSFLQKWTYFYYGSKRIILENYFRTSIPRVCIYSLWKGAINMAHRMRKA